jgi:hypothetical protein
VQPSDQTDHLPTIQLQRRQEAQRQRQEEQHPNTGVIELDT